MTLELLYDESLLERPHAISILESLSSLLRIMAGDREQRAGEIVKRLAEVIEQDQRTVVAMRPKLKLSDARPQLRKVRSPGLEERQLIR